MPILGTVASQFAGKPFSSYESIQTAYIDSGSQAYLTFTSIPQTFKHLQLRMITRVDEGATDGYIEYNADYTAGNYRYHRMFGNGGAYGSGSGASPYIFNGWQVGASNLFVLSIVDILDYTSSSKYKVTKTLTGFDTNLGTSNSSWVGLHSTLWKNQSAINEIRVSFPGGSFKQYTHAALYGIKGV